MQNQKIKLSGILESELTFSHAVYKEKFYEGRIIIERLSGTEDYIPIMVSERLIDIKTLWPGDFLCVNGEIRSYNQQNESGNSKLLLHVFAEEIERPGEEKHENDCFMEGFLCKEPIYRETPYGRQICDILVAVNRSFGKSDYIPCICWGRNAKFVSGISVGTKVDLWGRFQSRNYIKKISDTESETRTAYEVSISKLDVEEEHEETED